MYMGTLLIDVQIALYKLSYIYQSYCKIWTLINKVPLHIFGILKHHRLTLCTQFLGVTRLPALELFKRTVRGNMTSAIPPEATGRHGRQSR